MCGFVCVLAWQCEEWVRIILFLHVYVKELFFSNIFHVWLVKYIEVTPVNLLRGFGSNYLPLNI